MAGRALLAVLHLSDAQCRYVLLLVHEKVLQGGTSKTPEQRAFRRISPKYLDLCAVSLPIAKSFCGSLLERYLARMAYFDPLQDWPKPIEQNMTIPILLEDLVFLGDTRSRYELLVFAQANPARLPLAMGLAQPDITARRMANDRKVQLTDALVRVLVRFLTPVTVETDLVHDSYYREYLLPLAAHGDGHVLYKPKRMSRRKRLLINCVTWPLLLRQTRTPDWTHRRREGGSLCLPNRCTMQRSQSNYLQSVNTDSHGWFCYSWNGHEILLIWAMDFSSLASLYGWKLTVWKLPWNRSVSGAPTGYANSVYRRP